MCIAYVRACVFVPTPQFTVTLMRTMNIFDANGRSRYSKKTNYRVSTTIVLLYRCCYCCCYRFALLTMLNRYTYVAAFDSPLLVLELAA